MKKFLTVLILCAAMTYTAGLLRDMEQLHDNVIRLHVVGASDSKQDQDVKLRVKDAVNIFLQSELKDVTSVENARNKITSILPEIQSVAGLVLQEHGFSDPVTVTLEQEAFPRRDYDTFSLPSGVYHSLRIRIGAAEGKNWWCVVFPSLCVPEAGDTLRDTAAGAGFSESLTESLTHESDYEIRFFFLDFLGQIQNLWFEK